MSAEDDDLSEIKAEVRAATGMALTVFRELESVTLPNLTDAVLRDLTAHDLGPTSDLDANLIRATVASTYLQIVESITLALQTA